MEQRKSVVVCGGGVVGLCCAYFLAKEGHRVTLLERNAQGADSCAVGSAGYISPSYLVPLAAPGMVAQGLKWMLSPRSPFYVKPRLDLEFLRWGWHFWRASTRRRVEQAAPVLRDLAMYGLSWFEQFATATGNPFAFEKRGLFEICRTPQALEHEAHAAEFIRGQGVPAEVLDPAQTAARQPGVDLSVAGSIYFPRAGHVYPPALLATLTRAAMEAGADLRWNTPALGWATEGARVTHVKTPTENIAGDQFVLAGGAWSPGLARAAALGLRLPIQAGKGYSLTLEHPRQLPVMPMTCVEAHVAITPMAARLRFGGTMEFSGLNSELRAARVRQIIDSVSGYLPAFGPDDFAGVQPWVGCRPVSPDGLPYIGRFGRYPNLVAACGHAMLGLMFAPATAQLVTEIIAERKPSVPLELLRPDRYA